MGKGVDAGPGAGAGAALLAAHPAACDALAGLLGYEGSWQSADATLSGARLVARHPDTAAALEVLLAGH